MTETPDRAAASKAALGLPDAHPGYVPVSDEDWKPYVTCAACGQKLSLHMPSEAEREEQGVVACHANDATVGPLCSYACLAYHQPDHPISQGLHPDSVSGGLKRIQIEKKRAEIKALEAEL